MRGLVVQLNDKSEPTSIQIDGTSVFANSMDIQFRAAQPVFVVLEAYVKDLGGFVLDGPDGDPVLETKTFYAVSKEDFDLLQSLKGKA